MRDRHERKMRRTQQQDMQTGTAELTGVDGAFILVGGPPSIEEQVASDSITASKLCRRAINPRWFATWHRDNQSKQLHKTKVKIKANPDRGPEQAAGGRCV
jgi:hypothetical protein